ncbi:MAG: hypothetical protein LBI99_03735 [Propionibacteriaceae bacterium]|jgi:uncharacterized membrane protein YphA (DoxX/SURF4 family)|nr:hypothetical protein [Propionibacteriaceae bacterium]
MTTAKAGNAVLAVTERGLAVIVGFFATVFAVSLVVVVTSFLAVSNEPPGADADRSVAAAIIR